MFDRNYEDQLNKNIEESWQKDYSKRELEEKMKLDIESEYQEKIRKLESGEVDPKSFIGDEKLGFTPSEYARLSADKNKAFFKLGEMKYLLAKARKSAEIMDKRKRILSKITGKQVKDRIDFEKAEKSLDESETREYSRRLGLSEEEEPKEEVEEPEKEEEEEEKENPYYQAR